MRMTPKPTTGNCTIRPSVGLASRTMFYVTCEGFYDVLQPLTYIFFYNTEEEQDDTSGKGTLIGSGTDPVFHKTLPIGNKGRNYSACVEVRVRNHDGETNSVKLPVTTSPVFRPGYIVCESSHLSIFSGNLIVAPNKVDLFELKLFLGVFHNPIVIVTVFAFWCVFILMTVWARRKDSVHPVEADLIFFRDNVEDACYYYLVTVMTGWKNGGGTTSAVALYIAGTRASTRVHVIHDSKCVLETGSEKWFLLTTKMSLGDMRRLTVWHSCRGLFPSRMDFICDDWLSPQAGLRGIRRTLDVCNKGNVAYRFKVKSTQVVRDQHLWLSIFFPPPHGVFTRVQRDASGMSFIMVAMVTTIMFHGKGHSDDEFYLSKYGVEISLQDFFIGLECLFITSPISHIIVGIFSHILPRRRSAKVRQGRIDRCAWWYYYVAWFLAISSSLVATYVTVMYSLTYGYSASVKWTVSFFSTFFGEVVIKEPLKVSIWATLFSVFLGADVGPATPAEYYVKQLKDKDTQSFVYRKRGTLLQQMPLAHMYHLPAEDVVEQARRRLQKEREMWRTLQDVAVGVLLLGLLFTIAYGSTDRRSFYINKSITDTFVKARHSGRIALTEVKTEAGVWDYVKHTVLPAFHHNGTKYIADETNVLIGSAIIRQLRAAPGSKPCNITCTDNAFDTTSYLHTWDKPISDDLVKNPYSAWTYQSAATLHIGRLTCGHMTYPGGGYVIAIRTNRKRISRKLIG
ncbi:hypothetical protein NP493_835g01027 [Ridgeia piscesae]|uniref:PLAT domain-containing protein n=1 Tax=Ridgeia piscesae TaxID=27915 RepID=A0AAD9KMR5_RIDPI|nr:hypothetical protein NP493_835g01027 [Ridgeia piscesae]